VDKNLQGSTGAEKDAIQKRIIQMLLKHQLRSVPLGEWTNKAGKMVSTLNLSAPSPSHKSSSVIA
jgi:hypothetical protein